MLDEITTVFKMSWMLPFIKDLRQRLGLVGNSPTPVTKDQEVWLLDNTAFPTPNQPGKWSAEFVAAYFQEDSGSDAAKVVAEIADLLGFAGDEDAERRIAERVEPFLDMILTKKWVDVAFGGSGDGEEAGGKGIVRLGPAAGQGISVNELVLPGAGYVDDQVVESCAMLVEGKASMHTAFAEEEGWGVISDIDDTIKISEVRNRLSLLKHTFVDIPTPVCGMPQLYQTLQTHLHKPVWFYLSASPYNLYPLLREFTSTHFPRGQLILREMSWMELESFIMSLTMGTQRYKEERMRRVFAWLPRRKWVLIGDSTQKDPEAYATLYREFPDKVGAIWIRVVKGVDEKKERGLNSEERFEKAFKGVPKEVWRTFEEAREVEDLVGLLE